METVRWAAAALLVLNLAFFVASSVGLRSDVLATPLKYQMMNGRLAPRAGLPRI